MCVAEGCTARAAVVDHRIPRRWGGADTLSNLRSLCQVHHGRVTEVSDGSRPTLKERVTR